MRSFSRLSSVYTIPIFESQSDIATSPILSPSDGATGQKQQKVVPSKITLLNGRPVRVGGFKLAKGQSKALLAALLKPQGAINEVDAPASQVAASIPGDAWYRYEAETKRDGLAEPTHSFVVLVQVDSSGQLKYLTAQSSTHPKYNSEESAFTQHFYPRPGPSPIGLLTLPDELLLHIAKHTSTNGVDVSLRGVNQRLKGIADEMLSDGQAFTVSKGQTLEDIRYEGWEMSALGSLSIDAQNFVLSNSNCQALLKAGYEGWERNDLAQKPPEQQKFVLDNLDTLKAADYTGSEMNDLASQPPEEQEFALTYALRLKLHDYNGWAINNLAAQPPAERSSLLEQLGIAH
ncbi:hypothetical protein ACFQDN_21400 [Pseudomonas asuensis]|uniref:F-box domain-containing protein n=1 Tax=Pseudomonas asuensis TaxID=1825787 RepID=A0ABQ2H4M8_9PSED|nr:hypothetical protein [Pseudomonas asuensis]GGM31852.1 hypothetical protein GCM10009425_48040 [Pseudomonas asuensis]